MNEGYQLCLVMRHASQDSVISSGLGSGGGVQVWPMESPRCGTGRDHDVTGNLLSIRRKSDEVSAFAFRVLNGEQLFRVSVSASFATQVNPSVRENGCDNTDPASGCT